MNERRDEKWLDEELRRAVNTTRPEFDAEAWKRDHAEAYEALIARGQTTSGAGRGARCTVRLMAGWLAAAAVLLVGVAILLMQMPSRDPQGPVSRGPVKVTSPVKVVSMMTLRMAYCQGGEEGLNRQLDAALRTLGPRPNGLSMQDLFNDSDS
ncbi:MAG: hypothetical protein JSW27_20895 [Phycisphaerales bacterium]|nr:MAG: hypothetical protein JSW27_20895 [Phycisphaerales bacterium]